MSWGPEELRGRLLELADALRRRGVDATARDLAGAFADTRQIPVRSDLRTQASFRELAHRGWGVVDGPVTDAFRESERNRG